MTEEKRTRTLRQRVTSWTLGVLLVGLIAVLLVAVVIPLAMGWVPLTVLTGSMEPTISSGSQVVAKPLKPGQTGGMNTGDIITFMPEAGKDSVVTHRIVDVAKVDGEIVYRTKGDGNNAADPEPVPSSQVKGLVRYHVPLVGYLAQLTSPDQKRIGIWILAGFLLLYAGYEVVAPQLRKRRSAQNH